MVVNTLRYRIVKFKEFNPSFKDTHNWVRIDRRVLSGASMSVLRPSGRLLWVHLIVCCKSVEGEGRTTWGRIKHEAGVSRTVAEVELRKMQALGMIELEFEKTPLQTDRQTDKQTRQTDSKIRKPPANPDGGDLSLNVGAASPHSPSLDLAAVWNASCGTLAKAHRLTRGRVEKIRTRVRENPDVQFWETAIKKLAASEFAQQGKWANLDWLIANDTNAVKAFEGKYDDKGPAKPKAQKLTHMTYEDKIRLGMILPPEDLGA